MQSPRPLLIRRTRGPNASICDWTQQGQTYFLRISSWMEIYQETWFLYTLVYILAYIRKQDWFPCTTRVTPQKLLHTSWSNTNTWAECKDSELIKGPIFTYIFVYVNFISEYNIDFYTSTSYFNEFFYFRTSYFNVLLLLSMSQR